ncbi:MAG: EamA family transporter [Candidatus Aenigmarchaeota archaeon]|nr:EamA family transporter [Candidatus Aenigmarchaeota archaeon]
MASEGILFAVVTAVSFAVWTVFHQQASAHVNPVFGALVVSTTAAILAAIVLVMQMKGQPLVTDQRGIIFVLLAGIAAFAIDFFALRTYASGLPISIGGPVIIGGSVLIAAVIGLVVLGESISVMKIVGIALVVAGAGILASL